MKKFISKVSDIIDRFAHGSVGKLVCWSVLAIAAMVVLYNVTHPQEVIAWYEANYPWLFR